LLVIVYAAEKKANKKKEAEEKKGHAPLHAGWKGLFRMAVGWGKGMLTLSLPNTLLCGLVWTSVTARRYGRGRGKTGGKNNRKASKVGEERTEAGKGLLRGMGNGRNGEVANGEHKKAVETPLPCTTVVIHNRYLCLRCSTIPDLYRTGVWAAEIQL